MSIVISVTDSLRQSVEAATGGKNTVLYDSKGYPSIMAVIPKFNVQDIDASLGTGVHPAFVVGGVEKSEIFVGKFLATTHDGVALSLPGMNPARSINYDSAHALCRAKGPGWHLMTNAEWAALALWCYKNGFMPRGNNNFGRDSAQTYETARRVNGGSPGDASGDGATLTGSGPVSWSHDNSAAGICDMNGNIWEWQAGLRVNNGEINVIPYNDAALDGADHSAGSAAWKTIDGASGAYAAAGAANAVKYKLAGTTNYGLVRASGASFEGMTNPGAAPVGAPALALAKQLGLFPIASTGLGGDGFWLNDTIEALPRRGGDWNYAATAGVFALDCTTPRANVGSNLGFRPAFVA